VRTEPIIHDDCFYEEEFDHHPILPSSFINSQGNPLGCPINGEKFQEKGNMLMGDMAKMNGDFFGPICQLEGRVSAAEERSADLESRLSASEEQRDDIEAQLAAEREARSAAEEQRDVGWSGFNALSPDIQSKLGDKFPSPALAQQPGGPGARSEGPHGFSTPPGSPSPSQKGRTRETPPGELRRQRNAAEKRSVDREAQLVAEREARTAEREARAAAEAQNADFQTQNAVFHKRVELQEWLFNLPSHSQGKELFQKISQATPFEEFSELKGLIYHLENPAPQ
jgi:hypothetical protein